MHNKYREIIYKNYSSLIQDAKPIFDEIIDPKNKPSSQWKDQTVSLYKFANQDVKVIFVISTGPSMNNAYSFAVWGNPVMVAN